MNRQWLILTSNNYRSELHMILLDAGERVIVPASSHEYLPERPFPDVVVLDHDVKRYNSTVAAYMRGRGVPVVYVMSPHGYGMYSRMYHKIGCWLVNGPDGFRRWLASGPEYLAAPPIGPLP